MSGQIIDARTRRSLGPARIRANIVILAAGAVATPVTLKQSAVRDPGHHIGRHLQAHPGWAYFGFFDEVVEPGRSNTG